MKNRNLFKNAISANLSAVVFACTCQQVYWNFESEASHIFSNVMFAENLLPFRIDATYREIAEKIDEE